MIHILLADDDEHMLQLVRHYLQLEGYVVHEAKDGEKLQVCLPSSTFI